MLKAMNKPSKKLPTYQQLADVLGVTKGAVGQYNKRKRELMLKGLFYELNFEKL